MEELDLLAYVRVLSRWKWAILSLVVASMLTSYVASSMITPIYQATTTLLVKQSQDALQFAFSEALGTPGGKTSIQNYVEILKSRTLMELVVAKFGWDMPVGSEEFGALRGSVTVQPVTGTDAIKVTVEDPDPRRGMLVANALVDAFIEQSQAANRETARSAREFIAEQLSVMEGRLKRAEEALLSYRQSHQVISPSEESKAQIQKIAGLETLLAGAEVGLQEARASVSRVESELKAQDPTLVTSQTMSANPLIQQLKMRLVDLEASLAGAKERYSDKHPTVVALASEIQQVRDKLSREVARTMSSETTALNPIRQSLFQKMVESQAAILGLEAKREALKGLIAKAEAGFATIPEKELALARLQREQRVAEDIYVMLLTRHEEMRISEAMSLADIQRIDRAVLPQSPVKPRKLLNVAVAMMLGLMAGVGLAFVAESLDRSFKSTEQVEQVLQVPLLGTVPHLGSALVAEAAGGPLSWARVKRWVKRHGGTRGTQTKA